MKKFIDKINKEIALNGWKNITPQMHTDLGFAEQFIKNGEKPTPQFLKRIEDHLHNLQN